MDSDGPTHAPAYSFRSVARCVCVLPCNRVAVSSEHSWGQTLKPQTYCDAQTCNRATPQWTLRARGPWYTTALAYLPLSLITLNLWRCCRPAPGQHRGGRRGRGAPGALRLRHDGAIPVNPKPDVPCRPAPGHHRGGRRGRGRLVYYDFGMMGTIPENPKPNVPCRPAPGQHRGGRRGRGAPGVLRLWHDGHHPRRRARGPARALLRRVPEGALEGYTSRGHCRSHGSPKDRCAWRALSRSNGLFRAFCRCTVMCMYMVLHMSNHGMLHLDGRVVVHNSCQDLETCVPHESTCNGVKGVIMCLFLNCCAIE